MAKEQIIFDITPDGMKVETTGFKGKTCLTELEKFRAFMEKEGGVSMTVTNTVKKPEYFNETGTTIQNQERC